MKKLSLLRMFFIVVVIIRVFGGVVVRDAATRGKRFAAGVDPEKIRMNLAAHKESMVEQEKTYFAEIHGVEQKAKRIVEAAGVDVAAVAQYINIARKCYSLAKRFTGQTLTDEAQRVVNHWVSRGYNASLASGVCNISGCGTSAAVVPEPAAVVPREYFEHSHAEGHTEIPIELPPEDETRVLWKCPSNWLGFARIRWWINAQRVDAAFPLYVGMLAGTCGEAGWVHEVEVEVTKAVIDGFMCVEVLVDLNEVASVVEPCDLVQLYLGNMHAEQTILVFGVEIVESAPA